MTQLNGHDMIGAKANFCMSQFPALQANRNVLTCTFKIANIAYI